MDTDEQKEECRKRARELIAISLKEIHMFSQPPWKYLPLANSMVADLITRLPVLERMAKTGIPEQIYFPIKCST